MPEDKKTFKQLLEKVKDAAWDGKELLSAWLWGLSSKQKIRITETWEFERFKRAANVVGRHGGECNFSGLKTNWSDTKIRELKLMHSQGKAIPNSHFESNTYELGVKIGGGSFATVYKGLHKGHGGPVAIKVPKPTAKLDQREAQFLAQIRSPHVIHIENIGDMKVDSDPKLLELLEPELIQLGCTQLAEKKRSGQIYLVMEWVDGPTMEQRIKNGAKTDDDMVVRWMRHCCIGMIAAQEKDIIHRDLKPANLFIDQSNTLKIGDFGLAKKTLAEIQDEANSQTTVGTDAEEYITQSLENGSIAGSPEYMSPDHWRGKCTIQSDIYSFGVTFYHLVTGRKPFTLKNKNIEKIHQQHEEDVPDAPNVLAKVPGKISDLIMCCLEKDPANRFESFQDILETLKAKEVDPDADTLLMESNRKGWERIENGAPDQALRYFSKAIGNYADSAEARCGRGVAYMMKNDLENAIEDFDRAIRLKPESPEAFYYRGLAYFRGGDCERISRYENSIRDFTRVIRLQPDFVDLAYYFRALTYLKRNFPADPDGRLPRHRTSDCMRAISDLVGIGIALTSTSSELLGKATGRIGKATKVIASNVDLEGICFQTGRAFAMEAAMGVSNDVPLLGRYYDAIVNFNQAIDLDPELEIAYFNRGLAHLKDGHEDKAEKDFLAAGEKWTHMIPEKDGPGKIHIALLKPEKNSSFSHYHNRPRRPWFLTELIPAFPDVILWATERTEITVDRSALTKTMNSSQHTNFLHGMEGSLSLHLGDPTQADFIGPLTDSSPLTADVTGKEVKAFFDPALLLETITGITTEEVTLVFYYIG